MNPAPFQPLSDELLQFTDWLIPNEIEFLELQGHLPESDADLKNFRVGKNSIVTLGNQGAVYIDTQRGLHRVIAPQVKALDTTGAGDAFVGSFAYAIANGSTPYEAMNFGVKIASLTVSKQGAQSSYPNQIEIATLS